MNESNTVNGSSVLKQVRAVWARRKWLAILAFFAPLAAAVSLILAMPELYEAEVTVLVEPEVAAPTGGGGGEFEPRLQMISEELLSRSRLQQLIERFDLYPVLRGHVPSHEVVERMRRDIRLERKEVTARYGQGVTVAFTLGYRGWDPGKAADVVNVLASSYVEENKKHRARILAEREEIRRRHEVLNTRSQTGQGGELAQLKRRLVEMQARYSDRYPDVVQLKAEIAALEREMKLSEAAPVAAVNRMQLNEPSLPPMAPRLRILDSALAPRKPVAPARFRLMVIALVLAFAAAGFAVFLAEQLDTSFHRVDELWSFTHVPILTSVSRIVTRGDIWRRRLRFGFLGVLAISALVLLVGISWFVGQNGEPLVWTLAQRGV